jgi:hypothetical protein
LRPNKYPNTPRTKQSLEKMTNLMVEQVNREVELYRALVKEWRTKENAIPLVDPGNYTIDMSLDVDGIVADNLLECKKQRLLLRLSLRSIKNPIDLAILMFEHELLLAEITSIRQDILNPLTNPLSLISPDNEGKDKGLTPTLLKSDDLSGFYLQLEQRLGYILPARGENRITSFGRANPFFKVTMMDYVMLGFSVFLALGFLVQCSMVTVNTFTRWQQERKERLREQELFKFRVNRIEQPRPIRETVPATCESCSEKREMYRTRVKNKSVIRAKKYRGNTPSHLRVSRLEIS